MNLPQMCLVSRTVGRHRVVGGTNLIQFSCARATLFALVFRVHLSTGRAPSSSPPPPLTAAALSSAQVFSPATTDSTNPLSSLLPLSLNPFNATVDLITSRLKQQQQQQYDDELGGGGGELLEAHLLPFLRPQECLVNALCVEGRPSAARSLLKQMQLDGYEPGLEIYNSLMESFCKCEALESEALALKNEMVGKGIRPDIVTYRILIKCLCRSGKTFEGECLMKEMIEWDIQPDPGICAALNLACFFILLTQIADDEGTDQNTAYRESRKLCEKWRAQCWNTDIKKVLQNHRQRYDPPKRDGVGNERKPGSHMTWDSQVAHAPSVRVVDVHVTGHRIDPQPKPLLVSPSLRPRYWAKQFLGPTSDPYVSEGSLASLSSPTRRLRPSQLRSRSAFNS
ncbi:hypothetical protein OPV22_006930 [Ensete ventricosum]|uniref:Pentacotripeptide-repeat region of PRORP domain-containing protein n=1 Tax=Ensete ventricosum TaxID=4639 RepID=A0AAV8RTD4_ENSVE|nr:hypothetical protein OPV22_006930 [Ensete ventricosum]